MSQEMEHVEPEITRMKAQLQALSAKAPENKLSMVVLSGDLDKVLASFVIATGAVAMGLEVVMFFTSGLPPCSGTKTRRSLAKT